VISRQRKPSRRAGKKQALANTPKCGCLPAVVAKHAAPTRQYLRQVGEWIASIGLDR
jgi:hypothetical protein